MAKRFTETGKWKKTWLRRLSPNHKLFWFYLLDNCDHAGIWEVDIELAEFQIGMELDEKEILKSFGNRIQVIKSDKWFVPKFIKYQYGELNEQNRAHNSVIKILKKYTLYKPHTSPLIHPYESSQGAKDKDKDKVKDKEGGLGGIYLKIWKKVYKRFGYQETQYNGFTQFIMEAIHRIGYENVWVCTDKFLLDKDSQIKSIRYFFQEGIDRYLVETKPKSKFKKLKSGLWKAYCLKCGKKNMPNDYQLKQNTSCCGVEFVPEKPEIRDTSQADKEAIERLGVVV